MDEDQFPQEDIETIAKNAIIGCLSDQSYVAKNAPAWCAPLCRARARAAAARAHPRAFVGRTRLSTASCENCRD